MSLYDVVLGIIILLFAWRNFKKGILLSILQLAGLVAVALLMSLAGPAVKQLTTDLIGLEGTGATVVTILVLVAAIPLVAWLFDKLIKVVTKPLGLNMINRLLGGVFGLACGFSFVVILVLVIGYLPADYSRGVLKSAKGSYIVGNARKVAANISINDLQDKLSNWQEKIEDAIDTSAIEDAKQKIEDTVEDIKDSLD